MIRWIHRDRGFEKSLDVLKRRSGTAAAAIRKVDEIIERIIEQGNFGIDGVAKMTWNGEHRVKNSFKYILGGGYRLVCILEGDRLVLLFAGNHEECHRWIESNKGLTYESLGELDSGIPTRTAESGASAPARMCTEADEYEARLMGQLDDELLRRIFCGLCGESAQAQSR